MTKTQTKHQNHEGHEIRIGDRCSGGEVVGWMDYGRVVVRFPDDECAVYTPAEIHKTVTDGIHERNWIVA